MSFNSFSKSSDEAGNLGASAAAKSVATNPSTAVGTDKDVAGPPNKTPPKT